MSDNIRGAGEYNALFGMYALLGRFHIVIPAAFASYIGYRLGVASAWSESASLAIAAAFLVGPLVIDALAGHLLKNLLSEWSVTLFRSLWSAPCYAGVVYLATNGNLALTLIALGIGFLIAALLEDWALL